MIERASVDLPDPVSPTIANVSPREISKLTRRPPKLLGGVPWI